MDSDRYPGILSFEDARGDLVWMPFAARRALDAVGARLSLAAWQALSHDDRWSLVEAGAGSEVETRVAEAVLSRAQPPPERREPWHVPSAPTPALANACDDPRALAALWPQLGPLERYALVKIAASERRAQAERKQRVSSAIAALQPGRVRAAQPTEPTLTHLDARGEARMVDVAEKSVSRREAVAEARVRMERATLELLKSGHAPKGDVLATARIAGIQAAKRTSELIPLCHVVALSSVEVSLSFDDALPGVHVVATARALDRTGVEMEALVAASVAGLTLYDMLKAVDRGMTLTDVGLVAKSGGRSGDFRRGEP
jgi:molybdenum cofactor biosynthesis protein MoaC